MPKKPQSFNGRLKLVPPILYIVILLLTAGTMYGILISNQAAMAEDITEIKGLLSGRYYSKEEIDRLFAERDLRRREEFIAFEELIKKGQIK